MLVDQGLSTIFESAMRLSRQERQAHVENMSLLLEWMSVASRFKKTQPSGSWVPREMVPY